MANVPISAFTVPANTVGIGATGYSLTGSASASFVDLAGTWNTSGTPTAIKLNITDTGSNAASLLMDLQVGGASRASVRKGGGIKCAPSGNAYLLLEAEDFQHFNASGTRDMLIGGNGLGVSLNSDYTVSWGTSSTDTSKNLVIGRRGAANLRLGAADTTGTTAPTPQFLSAQSWASSTTNNQTGANFTIDGSQGTGTGAGGSIIFRVAPAGVTANGVQNALSTALTIDSTRFALFAGRAAFDGQTSTAYSVLGASVVATTQLGVVTPGSTNHIYMTQSELAMKSTLVFGFASGDAAAGIDVKLARDDANKLALRNGAAAQRFNVYNTWTSSTNYETFKIDWITTANTVLVGTEKGSGGGNARALAFQTDGTTRLTISTGGAATFTGSVNGVDFFSTGANGYSAAAGAYFFWAGRSSLDSPSDGVIRIANSSVADFGRLQFGGTTSSFPALKRSTTFLQARLADDSAFAGFASANMQAATAYTVATLPGTPGTGMIARVTDATAPTIGTTVVGGGAAYALVNYNGANWTVIGV